MSSILKALKKLENEKTVRVPNSLKIDTDILKTVDSPRKSSPYSLALLFLLVFGGGAAVALYFIKDTKAPQETATSQPATSAKTLQTKVPPPPIKPETLPAEIVVVPARKEPSVEVSRTQRNKPPVAGKAAKVIDKRAPKAAVADIPERRKAADVAEKGAAPAAAVPSLRVNGIAFQNSGADSMAIVNGVPVSHGSVIEGTTVEEVRKDRVLFQQNGEKFEIMLGQSNR
ncbi:MAG: general secretion pathway protein GspB [Desulfuromonadaceae bacterium]